MKPILVAALIAISAAPVCAGELFSGTLTYRPDSETWTPVPAAGWRTVKMVGEYVPTTGPIPAGQIECRGTNYWNQSTSEADGVCVFGELPDSWMLRYRMTQTNRASQSAEQFRRIGEWIVVGGNGRYSGMTGSGTYMAEGAVAEGGKWRTQWEGEVTIPK